jgi:exodeoxyribonuclease V alpha subunit
VPITIYGCVTGVRHQGDDFCIFDMAVDKAEPRLEKREVCVSGHLYGLAQVRIGVTIGIVGEWIDHPKYGRQIQPFGWKPYSRTVTDIERFLSVCLRGFEDPDVVRLLVTRYEQEVYDKLRHAPDEIRALYGPDDPKRAAVDKAIAGWEQAYSMSALASFLRDHDIGAYQVRAIFDTLGNEAVNYIAENPYCLVAVEGFSFTKADRLAQRLGIDRNDGRRIEGAILAVLWAESRQGHLFVRRGDLPTLLDDLMAAEFVEAFAKDVTSETILAAVDRMVERKFVHLDTEAGIYLPDLFKYEREAASKLARFVTPVKLEVDITQFLLEYEKNQVITLSDAQREAVRLNIENRVLALTGGPGTGKTTLVRTFVRLFKQLGISCQLMAPTGIAAKRLAAVTGNDAATIHRTFGYNGKKWQFNCFNKFNVGAVIVDEMSMVDMELFYRVLDALHPTTMLVLVGDDAQLPSVGPGNVLRELLTCSNIPHVRLTQIFRQAEKSDIVKASHRIVHGESLVLEGRPNDSDFQFVNCADEPTLTDLVVKMAAKLKSRDANFQVLSPKYDGVTGVTNLNERLREALNPESGKPEWRAGKVHMRVGDRVMVTKNDYDLNVYNGDMGKLHAIHKDSVVVKIHGSNSVEDLYVTIPKTRAIEMLRLAYCITVHKSQGSEFDTIIMPIVKAHGRMRQRNLFYTAVTRAKKKVWLLGDTLSVHHAISNDKVVQRNTVFGRAVRDAVAALAGVEPAHERVKAGTETGATGEPLPAATGSPEEAGG